MHHSVLIQTSSSESKLLSTKLKANRLKGLRQFPPLGFRFHKTHDHFKHFFIVLTGYVDLKLLLVYGIGLMNIQKMKIFQKRQILTCRFLFISTQTLKH